MSNFLKDLNLDRTKIKEQILDYCKETFTTYSVSDIEHQNNTLHRCTIIGDDKSIEVDFYYKGNGTTTIRPIGGNPDDSFKIGLYIKTNLCHIDVPGSSYSIPNVDYDSLSLLIEYLNVLPGVSKIYEDETDTYTLFKFKSDRGDKLALKYYKNKRLQIQGKPLYLYQEVTCFLAEFYPFEDIVIAQSEFFSVSITKDELQDAFESMLPNAKDFLGERLKAVLAPALAYKQIDIILPDYSGFVFPVLRALEGYIKLLFQGKNINIKKRNGFDKHTFFHDGKHFLQQTTKDEINCNFTCGAIERAYNYFQQHRNGLFHADSIDVNIRLVETKQEAVRIIDKTFEIIEETYKTLPIESSV
ncbi:type II toxin-antitoxin system RnlA family toxin [Paenibacillus taichungensis]|uniref:type II toxin-antitoxin system RnlA family toxin n=1 Tax=Paenibacillus taichungensis TaxID=484184 RepID=UPI0035E26B07